MGIEASKSYTPQGNGYGLELLLLSSSSSSVQPVKAGIVLKPVIFALTAYLNEDVDASPRANASMQGKRVIWTRAPP
jgi:hypothetical protein